MKFAIDQSVFASSIALASKAVASRPSHPILAFLLMVVDEDEQSISLTGFDNSIGITTTFPAQIEEGGKIALPARLLNDIVSRLSDAEISFSSSKGENEYQIKSNNSKYSIRGMTSEDFPELPYVEEDAIALDPANLQEALKSTLFAVSSDETKQVLTGAYLSIGVEGLEACSTDGHRLAVFGSVQDKISECTIPSRALNEVQRLAEKTKDPIQFKMDQGQAMFEFGNTILFTRLLEGQYPNYRQLIPRQFSRQLNVDRRALLQSLERISVLADQKNNIVKLSLDSAQELILSVDAQDVGSGRESLPAQFTGDAIDIAFNVKYLLDVLKVLGTSEVMIQINTPTSPAVISPIGGAKFTGLIMPVQIRD